MLSHREDKLGTLFTLRSHFGCGHDTLSLMRPIPVCMDTSLVAFPPPSHFPCHSLQHGLDPGWGRGFIWTNASFVLRVIHPIFSPYRNLKYTYFSLIYRGWLPLVRCLHDQPAGCSKFGVTDLPPFLGVGWGGGRFGDIEPCSWLPVFCFWFCFYFIFFDSTVFALCT